ncbi:MAG: PEP-CTERM sorting domain-containing protein [Caldimonas sp.]
MSKATSIISALALAATCLVAAPAQAALTLTGVPCDGHSTILPSQPGYLDCSGAFSGNNLNQAADVQSEILADFGLTGLTSVVDITGGNAGATTGTLSFAAQTGPFVISLKAGDAFSLYEFDAGISSINFDTKGVGFFSGPNQILHFGQELSHADLYTSPIPEPETYALLLAGLAAVGFVARRRRQA